MPLYPLHVFSAGVPIHPNTHTPHLIKYEHGGELQVRIVRNGSFELHIYFLDLAGESEIRWVQSHGRSCIRTDIKGFIAREQQRHCSLHSAFGEQLTV